MVIGIAASFPTRFRFASGPGSEDIGSRLKTLRPHEPEKSGIGAALSAVVARNSRAVLPKRAALSRACSIRSPPSKIRLVGFGHTVIEQIQIALDANVFLHRLLHAIPAHRSFPRLIEGVGIIDRDLDLHGLAGIDHAPALDDMQLFGVRRAELVDKRLGVEPDGVDYERVALVM